MTFFLKTLHFFEKNVIKLTDNFISKEKTCWILREKQL